MNQTTNNQTADIQKQAPMPRPSNDIDLQTITIFPHISSDYVSDRVRNKFRDFDYVRDADGKVVNDEAGNPKIRVTRDYWSVMELFTQDLRLGNLKNREAEFVRYHIDLSVDIQTVLPQDFNRPALIAFERAVNVNETSQGRDGFLRTLLNTFFSHSSGVVKEASSKRSFFGLGKKNKVE